MPFARFFALIAVGVLIAALLGPACSGADRVAAATLEITVGARAFAPGEPIRVRVTSPVPLAKATATLLDESVFLFALDDSGERWSGWSMIGLDQQPANANLEVRGSTRDGGEIQGSHPISISAKEFPEENLSVSSKYVEPPKAVQERIARERAKLAKIYRRREVYAPPSAPFVRPVAGVNTSVFGMRRLFNGQPRSPHPGLDLRAAEGTPVHAAGPGRVVLAEELYYSGNLVIVEHGGGLFTLYGHLSTIEVAEGDLTEAGSRIGLSGSSGRVTGPHLHWGAKIGTRPFDPEALLADALF